MATDRRADGHGATQRLAAHNVVAVFDDLDTATAALSGLRSAGLTDDELSLLGRTYAKRPGMADIQETPTISTGGLGKAGLLGFNAASLVGGLVGAAIGAGLWFAGVFDFFPLWGTIVTVAFIGAFFAQIPGMLIGLEAGARRSMMWTQTFGRHLHVVERERVLVGVHTSDAGRAEEAERVLAQLADGAPTVVERLDADTSFGSPGMRAATAGTVMPTSHPERPGAERD